MKKCLIVLISSIFFLSLHAQNLSEKEISNWFTYYYKSPKPELTLTIIKKFSDIQYLSRPNALAPLSAFFSIIFTDNPKEVPNWIEKIKVYNEKEKKVFYYALNLSRLDNKQVLMNELISKKNAPIQGLEYKNTLEIPIESPAVCDMLWGGFMASGDKEYVQRIITVLPYITIKGDIPKLLIGGAAKWSLTSNAIQHEKVLKICKESLKAASPEVKKVLQTVITDAEIELKKLNVQQNAETVK